MNIWHALKRHGAAAFTILALSVLVGSAAGAQAPAREAWTPFERFLGKWTADSGGGGQPGVLSTGGESWTFDLDQHVLVRRDFSDYPATKGRAATHHEGFMVITPDAGAAYRGHYHDNEGHNIDYDIAVRDSAVVFTSRPVAGQPQFRLTYTISATRGTVRFEIAPPNQPGAFQVYVSGGMHRAS